MSSDKFIKTARKIAKEDAMLFDMLMEFEKTKKIRTKRTVTFTVDKAVFTKFRNYAKERSLNMSAKVEQALRKMVEEDAP